MLLFQGAEVLSREHIRNVFGQVNRSTVRVGHSIDPEDFDVYERFRNTYEGLSPILGYHFPYNVLV